MKKLEFTLSDSKGCFGCHAQVQAKFDNWYKENIESAPVVYGPYKSTTGYSDFSEDQKHADVYQARLICIEEIKNKECEHDYQTYELELHWRKDEKLKIICPECKKELVPKNGWECVEVKR